MSHLLAQVSPMFNYISGPHVLYYLKELNYDTVS